MTTIKLSEKEIEYSRTSENSYVKGCKQNISCFMIHSIPLHHPLR